MNEVTQEEILKLLCQRLTGLAKADFEITAETNLITQLAIDSIKLLNLIMEIEDNFDISVPVNALTDVITVRDLEDLIYRIKSESK